jgi:hypothetical protein
MILLRRHVVSKIQRTSRIQLLRHAACFARIHLPIFVLPPPETIRPRLPPQWEHLQVSSLMLVPVPTARHLLWRSLSATFDNYFLNNCAAYPFGFCRVYTFLFDILQQSNCQEAYSCCSLIDVTCSAEQFDIYRLWKVLFLSVQKAG